MHHLPLLNTAEVSRPEVDLKALLEQRSSHHQPLYISLPSDSNKDGYKALVALLTNLGQSDRPYY